MKKNRIVAFGISFYLVNLLLVVQFMLVGSAIIADRYTYIPYIGLFLILGWMIERLTKKSLQKAYSFIILIAAILSVVTFRQAGVWKNGATLWDQAIKSQPSSKAYANRALLLRQEKNYSLAIEYYRKAIGMNKIDHEANGNLGNVFFDLQKPDSAFYYYRQALSIKPDYVPTLDNIGAMFATMGQYDSALKYLSRALELKPDHKPAYSNRALVHMRLNKYEEAIKDWQSFLRYEPDVADVYNSIGVCYQYLGKYDQSLAPINKAINLKATPEFYLTRSYSYYGLNNLEKARADA
jgi:tetratricopeptide (TPR) repeat protein